ncbi:MAG: GNAT family N-acetyltransferase [Oscillatoria sp. PMC 1051.18]|nr:GNAT family N-acetyltransferase [Oscillatoria sp. PMC 1050.18]MEC5031871.1 GNAT family N-acetyltransferase [Oscillatoria sp. PMC 1051.18]
MIINSCELPSKCHLRPAHHQDKWQLQKLIWEFSLTEAWELDLRIIFYRFFLVVLLLRSASILTANFPSHVTIIETILKILIFYNLFYLFWFVLFLFLGTWINWSNYWVVECQNKIVACALLNCYPSNSELAYLYVKSAWRQQNLATCLIQRIVREAPKPLYLVCKPKLVKFYARQGFVKVTWRDLSPLVKAKFSIFQPHPKLWGFPLLMMEYKKR